MSLKHNMDPGVSKLIPCIPALNPKKFGLISVNPISMERTLKKSGWWYKEVIENNGF